MSKAHEEAGELLDNLLRNRANTDAPSLNEIEDAIDRIEELSKLVQTDEDEEYLKSVAETLLNLRAAGLAEKR